MTGISNRIHLLGWIAVLSGVLAVGCSQPEQPAEMAPTPEQPAEMAPTPEAQDIPEMAPPVDSPTEGEQAATVNGEPIMLAEVRAMFEERFAPYRGQIPEEQLEAFWQSQMPVMLEMAIGQRLIRNEIAEHELSASDAEIEAKLAEFKEQIPEGQTLESLTGQSPAQISEAIGDMLTYEKLLEIYDLAVAEPSDQQVEEYYQKNPDEFQMPESVQARHILIMVDDDADDETRTAKRAEIEAIHRQLTEEDASFEELAAEHSDCPSRQQGGDLGSFGRGQMVPAFEEAAFAQEPGAIGDVVETDFGYHIIQVMDKEAARQVSLDEVREHITGRLQEQKHREHQELLLKELRAESDIRYFIP